MNRTTVYRICFLQMICRIPSRSLAILWCDTCIRACFSFQELCINAWCVRSTTDIPQQPSSHREGHWNRWNSKNTSIVLQPSTQRLRYSQETRASIITTTITKLQKLRKERICCFGFRATIRYNAPTGH
jgi:hypothetical protein